MEIDSATIVHGPQGGGGTKNGTSEVGGGAGKDYSSAESVKGKEGELGNVVDMDSGDVNMEASITADDMMRAGGFGARDDISNFLPVASDSTDFEASLRDARDYEEPQKEVCRPGLGWKDVKD